jgi:hypothetical protein
MAVNGKILSYCLPGGTVENHETPSQDRRLRTEISKRSKTRRTYFEMQ